MTNLEQHALQHIIDQLRDYGPSAPGSAYDENFKPIPVPELVPGTPNHKLLENEFYVAGYKRAVENVLQELIFLLHASKEQLIRFAGKPKRKKGK